jgi:hypothetical protein
MKKWCILTRDGEEIGEPELMETDAVESMNAGFKSAGFKTEIKELPWQRAVKLKLALEDQPDKKPQKKGHKFLKEVVEKRRHPRYNEIVRALKTKASVVEIANNLGLYPQLVRGIKYSLEATNAKEV